MGIGERSFLVSVGVYGGKIGIRRKNDSPRARSVRKERSLNNYLKILDFFRVHPQPGTTAGSERDLFGVAAGPCGEVLQDKLKRIKTPFPEGESFQLACLRFHFSSDFPIIPFLREFRTLLKLFSDIETYLQSLQVDRLGSLRHPFQNRLLQGFFGNDLGQLTNCSQGD